MTNAPAATYQAALTEARTRLEREEGRFRGLSLARLAVFAVGAVAGVMAVLSRGGPGARMVVVAAAAFGALIVWHERVARRRDRAARSAGYYERGLARLEGRWTTGGDDGSRFADETHLFSADLELFGPGSLFHYLSTARTETGAETLARWLAAPADPPTIEARQSAVRELAGRLVLRHDLALVADEAGSALDSAALRRWLAGDAATLPGWLAPVAGVLGLVNLVAVAVALAGLAPGFVVLPGFLASLVLNGWASHRVKRILADADRPAAELRVVAALVARLAGETFASPRLAALLEPLAGQGRALRDIRGLERLVDLVDARRNQLFIPISALLLLGTQLAVRIERWRLRVGPVALGWLESIGELEALISLATRAFEHPADAFPEIGAAGAPVRIRDMAHPLLPAGSAVPNDVLLGDPVRLVMVSGSNMSGKSTLLKAVGTNLVLAYAGAPVRATACTVGRWDLGASLVLRESLLEGRSRFYAEILRLRDVVQAADRGRPVLFLLDELLSGTNSHDRAIGARGILDGLVARGAIGIVTTHDLALTDIATELGARGANWHLEDTLVEGRLRFDFRLKDGVVRRSNALELMKAVGLEVPAREAEPDGDEGPRPAD